MKLLEAYARYARAGRLWPQLQGDCGVYSFYYATLLLQAMNPGKKYPLVFPRKYKSDSSKWARQPYKTSVRQWVKSTGGLNSGQGEILTLGEMQRVISHFGYESTCAAKNNIHVRRDFITRELAAGHPVLIAFMEGGTSPHCYPTSTPAEDTGAHWSVIIDDSGGDYTWIDPHKPEKLYRHTKDDFLKSNAAVDSHVLGRFWAKLVVPGDRSIKSLTEIDTPTIAKGPYYQNGEDTGYRMNGKVYDVYKEGRGSQQLNGAIISVW